MSLVTGILTLLLSNYHVIYIMVATLTPPSLYFIMLTLVRSGAFFFMIMNQVFSNMSAVDLFIRRKALFM